MRPQPAATMWAVLPTAAKISASTRKQPWTRGQSLCHEIQDTVRAAVEEARFSQVVGKMREAKAAQMDTHDVPAVVKLASKEFHITDSESTGVLQRLIESNDLTLYGLSTP